MIDRAMLHQLIDRLPEESLENIQRAVQYEGLAPSTVGRIPEATAEKIRRTFEQQRNAPDDWETLHKRMAQGEQRRVRHLRELRGGDRGSGNATEWKLFFSSGFRQAVLLSSLFSAISMGTNLK